jgi:hypothetical protein
VIFTKCVCVWGKLAVFVQFLAVRIWPLRCLLSRNQVSLRVYCPSVYTPTDTQIIVCISRSSFVSASKKHVRREWMWRQKTACNWNVVIMAQLSTVTFSRFYSRWNFIGTPKINTQQFNHNQQLSEHTSVVLQALTNLGRLSSRRWQSFPTAPDGTGLLTCGQHIESHSCIFSFPNRTVTSLFK